MRRNGLFRVAHAAAALAAAAAFAQTPPPAAPLPEPNALPTPPTALPGPDPRACGPTKWSALCAAGRWTQFSHIELRVSGPHFSGRYEIERAANGEVHATYRERSDGNDRGGEVVLLGIDGIAYRTRDKLDDPSIAIDVTMSMPIMMSQLSALLLDLGVLGPPSDVTAAQAIHATSATQYLRAAAPRKALLFGPTWTMTGTVRPAGTDKVGFAMRLRYRPVDRQGRAVAGRNETLTLDGVVSYAPPRPALPDTFDLVGWKLQRADMPLSGVATLGAARESVTQ